jgi:hypothetical protein
MRSAPVRVAHCIAAITLVALALPNIASAQRRDQHVVDGGRIAAVAPAPAPIVIVQPGSRGYGYGYGQHRNAFGYSPYGYFPNAAVVQNIPVVMLQDGRVFANFGYGYERVIRTCSANGFAPMATGYSVPAMGGGSTIVQPTPVQPIAVQPARAQATESEQMLVRALSPATIVTAVPGPYAGRLITQSCWSNYGGSVFVFRR